MGVSRACWQNCSQKASGGSFWAFLELAAKIVPRRFLGGSFSALLGLAGEMAFRKLLGSDLKHFQGWLTKLAFCCVVGDSSYRTLAFYGVLGDPSGSWRFVVGCCGCSVPMLARVPSCELILDRV